MLVGYLDEGPESNWNGRFIILTPKYGETKKNNLRLAYFLAANGFKVLRFDYTNHVGESEGEMSRFTLPGAVEDMIESVTYVENHFEPSEIVLISNSLSARCAYRTAARDPRVSRVVCIVGVVNLQQTIRNIYQKDIIGTFIEGKEWGVIDILGFDIDSAHFISRLAEEDMHDAAGTEADAARIQKPLLHLHASEDIWVDRDEVAKIVRLAGGRLVEVEGAYHEIGENPEASRKTMESVARFCLEGTGYAEGELKHPSKAVLFEQNRKERNRLKEIFSVQETENEFWNGYLGKFGTMEQAKAYIEYFEKVQKLLGTLNEDEVVVDVGCGNGFFGLCLMHSLESALGTKSDFPHSFVYYGIDLTPSGVQASFERQADSRARIGRAFASKPRVTLAYQRLDFDRLALESANGHGAPARLPFADASVAKACCSLVVSYLKDPVSLLREIRRVLQPGGTLVFSSMKPDCDLTVLYHDFITKDENSEGSGDSALELLGAAGRIKYKEQSGIYGFFSEEELVEMARGAGFSDYDFFRSLGGQANVIRVVK